MSMLCNLYRITPERLTMLKAFPDDVGELVDFTAPPPKVGLLSKLFGKSPKQVTTSGRRFEPIGEADTFELNQAWHILHFLFSGNHGESSWPSGFLMSGGKEVGPDQGYGPIRLLGPELSHDVATFLNALSFKRLESAYVTSEIQAAEIYWQASSDEAERQQQVQELWDMVKELQIFFEHIARAGNATLVSIY